MIKNQSEAKQTGSALAFLKRWSVVTTATAQKVATSLQLQTNQLTKDRCPQFGIIPILSLFLCRL